MKCEAYFIGVKAISLGHVNDSKAYLTKAKRISPGQLTIQPDLD